MGARGNWEKEKMGARYKWYQDGNDSKQEWGTRCKWEQDETGKKMKMEAR